MSDPGFVSRSVQLRNRASEVIDDLKALRWRLSALAAVLVVAAGVFGLSRVGTNHPAGTVNAFTSTSLFTPTTRSTAQLVVYVVGSVRTPGLYPLTTSARVSDAVAAAGGFTADADSTAINLAAKVADGQRVYVTRKGEAAPPDVSASGGGVTGPVNINSASSKDLEALPGVGPATAAAIVQYRTQHGSFASVGDLAKVKGIGPSKLEQIKAAATA